MTSTRVKPSPCVNCVKICDAATCVDQHGALPSPGDMTICLGCGHLMTYSDDLSLREPTDAELLDVAGDVRLIGAQNLRAEYLFRTLGDAAANGTMD